MKRFLLALAGQMATVGAIFVFIIGFWADLKSVWEDLFRPVPLYWTFLSAVFGAVVFHVWYWFATERSNLPEDPGLSDDPAPEQNRNQIPTKSDIESIPTPQLSQSTSRTYVLKTKKQNRKQLAFSTTVSKEHWFSYYRVDAIEGVLFLWRWEDGPFGEEIVGLQAYCPHCLQPMAKDHSKVTCILKHCGYTKILYNNFLGVQREIMWRAKTGEWKGAKNRIRFARGLGIEPEEENQKDKTETG